MIELRLIFTRPTIIPAIMSWYEGVGEYLEKEVGIGMVEHVFYFNKGIIRSYRSSRQLGKLQEFIIKNPELIIEQLKLADELYENLNSYKSKFNLRFLTKNPQLFGNFYKAYLATWKPNLFAVWAPQFIKEKEIGKCGPAIHKLARRARKMFDPMVFVSELYINLIKEIGKDRKLLFLCTNKEFEKYLQGRLSSRQKDLILKRDNGWIVFQNHSSLVSSFEKAQNFCKKFGYILEKESKISPGKITVLRGQVGSKGKTKGKVKLLLRYEDNRKVRKGDIIVSPMTNPVFMPAISKCKAIITDEGGITCHAAIVSRELNIPCIIGTKIATAVLCDGDLVEVDANKGIVRKL